MTALLHAGNGFHVLLWGACILLAGLFFTRRPPGPPRRRHHF